MKFVWPHHIYERMRIKYAGDGNIVVDPEGDDGKSGYHFRNVEIRLEVDRVEIGDVTDSVIQGISIWSAETADYMPLPQCSLYHAIVDRFYSDPDFDREVITGMGGAYGRA